MSVLKATRLRHLVSNKGMLLLIWCLWRLCEAENWCYSCATVERVEEGSVVEIDSIHAVFTHVAENMIG